MSAPQRLVLFLGGALGLVMVLLAPGWFGGADEGTHAMRSLAMARGHLLPTDIDGVLTSTVPAAHRESVGIVIRHAASSSAPNSSTLLGDLLAVPTDPDDTVGFDTGSTMASSPVGYAPSALFMVVPNLLDAPPMVTLWFGRLGDLLVYLALAVTAVGLAAGFRWTLALTALFPMNLAMAASVSPDAVTIGALLVVVALWTRVWRGTEDGDATADSPGRLAAMIGAAGVLLALAKPPYFAVLAAFPALLILRRQDLRARVAALAATGALAVGVGASLVSTSNDYRSAGAGMFAELRFQPEVQIRRITDAPLSFLLRCVTRWFEAVPDSVQRWTRQLGFWRSSLPPAVAWLIVLGFILAAVILDADDLLGLRRFCRAIFAVGTGAILLALLTSSYVYFDDTLDGVHMTEQIGRYSLPLFAIGVMGWAPRWPLRTRLRAIARTERARTATVTAASAATTICVVAVVVQWWWPGVAGPFTGY